MARSQVEPNIPLRFRRRADKREFMFVNKKAFLSRISHQRKQQASIHRLMVFGSFSSRVSQDDKQASERANLENPKIAAAGWCEPPLIRYLGQGYVDPFSIYSLPLTDSMNMHLHHCMLFRNMLKTLYFRIKAIQSLKDLLHNPATAVADSTVLIVGALLTIEALNADFDALQAHTEGLKTLISLMGGLDVLEHMTLPTVYQYSASALSVVTIAALQNSAPILPILLKFRAEILQESKIVYGDDIEYRCEIPETLACLGARFQSAAWSTKIYSSMKFRIEVFRRLVRHFELGNLLPNIAGPTDNDLFVVFQHQLHSIHYASESHNLNEPLRITLLVYLYLRVSHVWNYPIMQYMVEHLRRSLDGLSYIQDTAPDLLFWILFIGGMASQGHRSHPWFVLQLADMVHSLGLKEWVDVRALLGELFYTDQPGKTAGEDLWNEVLIGSFRHIAPNPTTSVIGIQ
ncbi:hypothetical protein BJX63DRAFT_424701 [Aspergillus granulosus]|uniref:Uncharacterized protein n=1 Tax=Aspergillus granulosus TaxID=176169 RepID=A0ABR4GYS5_9EURO